MREENSVKILIVDDFKEYREMLRALLRAEGYSPIAAENGMEGVELAQKELPGLILMDIRMPVMNGEDAMKILKAEPATSHIPILAVTGCSLDSDRERFMLAGFDGFIAKPIDFDVFLDVVREVAWRQARQERGSP